MQSDLPPLLTDKINIGDEALTLDMRTNSESRTHRAVVSWWPPVRAHTAPTASPLPTSSSTVRGSRAAGSSRSSLKRPLMMMYSDSAASPCLRQTQTVLDDTLLSSHHTLLGRPLHAGSQMHGYCR